MLPVGDDIERMVLLVHFAFAFTTVKFLTDESQLCYVCGAL